MIRIKGIVCILLISLGVFIFIYGGYDDSPGAQGLGLLAVVLGIWQIIKFKRKKL
jgi:hypothetical protein